MSTETEQSIEFFLGSTFALCWFVTVIGFAVVLANRVPDFKSRNKPPGRWLNYILVRPDLLNSTGQKWRYVAATGLILLLLTGAIDYVFSYYIGQFK